MGLTLLCAGRVALRLPFLGLMAIGLSLGAPNTAVAQGSLPLSQFNTTATPSTLINHVQYGEADGDGVPDFFVNSAFFSFGIATAVEAYLADTSGVLRSNKWRTGPNSLLGATRQSVIQDFNHDGLDDAAFISGGGSLDVYLSTGNPLQPYAFSQFFDLNAIAPRVSFWETHLIGGFLAADFDQDTNLDLLVAGQVADMWSGFQTPVPVHYAMGGTSGMFGTLTAAITPAGYTPNAAILGQWADVDPSPALPGKDTVVLSTDQVFHPSVYTFPGAASWIETLRYQNGALRYQGNTPFGYAGSVRPTTLALEDLTGDQIPEIILGGIVGGGTNQWGIIEVHQGSATGVPTGNPTQLVPAAPANPVYQIADLEIIDFEKNGRWDVTAVVAYDNAAPAEVLRWEQAVPNSISWFNYPDSAQLPGTVGIDGIQYLVNWGPVQSRPHMLEWPDFNKDQYPDLSVSGLIQVTATNTRYMVSTSMNPTVSALNDDGFVVDFGAGTATSDGRTPRTGTAGGLPVLGNSSFGINLTNAPPSATVMGHAGTVAVTFPIGDWLTNFYPDPLYNSNFLTTTSGTGPGQGRAFVSIAIPNNPGLLGQDFYFTFSVLDLNRPAFPFAFADSIHVRPGVQR